LPESDKPGMHDPDLADEAQAQIALLAKHMIQQALTQPTSAVDSTSEKVFTSENSNERDSQSASDEQFGVPSFVAVAMRKEIDMLIERRKSSLATVNLGTFMYIK